MPAVTYLSILQLLSQFPRFTLHFLEFQLGNCDNAGILWGIHCKFKIIGNQVEIVNLIGEGKSVDSLLH